MSITKLFAWRQRPAPFPRFVHADHSVPLGGTPWEHRIVLALHHTSISPRHHVQSAIIGTPAACSRSAVRRLNNDTHGAPSFGGSWTSDLTSRAKTVVAECRHTLSSDIIIIRIQGNDSRRLQPSDTPPELYPTCHTLAMKLVHRARDAVKSHIQYTRVLVSYC